MQTKCQLSKFAGGKKFFCLQSILYSICYNRKISGAGKVADVFRHRLPDCQVFGIVYSSFTIYSSFLLNHFKNICKYLIFFVFLNTKSKHQVNNVSRDAIKQNFLRVLRLATALGKALLGITWTQYPVTEPLTSITNLSKA